MKRHKHRRCFIFLNLILDYFSALLQTAGSTNFSLCPEKIIFSHVFAASNKICMIVSRDITNRLFTVCVFSHLFSIKQKKLSKLEKDKVIFFSGNFTN